MTATRRRLAPLVAAFALAGSLSCDIFTAPVHEWTVMLCCGPDGMALGDTARFLATAREYFIGDGPEISSAVTPAAYTWRSSNPAAATVDGQGLVRAVAPGSTTIEATLHGEHGGRTGKAALLVVPPIARLAVSASADTIAAGDTVRVRIVALDTLGEPVPGAVVRIYNSQGMTVVHAEARVTENEWGRLWTPPASLTFRIMASGEYVVTVARTYTPTDGSDAWVDRTIIVR